MRPVLLLAPLLFGGCSLLTADDDSALFTTDAARYDVRQTSPDWLGVDPIVYSYTNTRLESVYLPGCGGPVPSLQKRVDGAWVGAWFPVVTLCLGPSVRVQPGQTYVDTLRVSAGLPGTNTAPQFETWPVEGTYRLVLEVDRTEDPEDLRLVPLGARASQPFELREVPD